MPPSELEIRALWWSLKPIGYADSWTPEPWSHYWSRIGALLPNFPPVGVEQWLWRHYGCATEFSWLYLPELAVTLEHWPAERILSHVHGWRDHGLVEKWTEFFMTSPDANSDWLAQRMCISGTWPQPIMVIKNDFGLRRPDGLELSAPFHLMEGHHRLGFFRALSLAGAALEPVHEVLAIVPPAAAILDYWPLNRSD